MFAVFCTKDKTGSNWCGQIVYKVPEICHGHQDRIKEKSVEGSVGTEQLNSFKNDRQLQAIRKHPSKMLTVCLPTVHASVSTRCQYKGRWKASSEQLWTSLHSCPSDVISGAIHWGPMAKGFGLPEQWCLMSRRGRHYWKYYLPTTVWTIEILQIFLYFRSIHVKGSCYLEIVNFVINMYYSLNWSVSSDKRSHSPMIKK